MPMKTTTTMTRSITSAIAMVDTVRKYLKVSDFPMQQLATLLHVADRGEVPQADLEHLTGVNQSSCSRNVARLGRGESVNEPGYGLMESYEDPHFRKRKLVRLTARGEALMAEIDKAMTRYSKGDAR